MNVTMIECLDNLESPYVKCNIYFSENSAITVYIKSEDLQNYQTIFKGIVVEFQ